MADPRHSTFLRFISKYIQMDLFTCTRDIKFSLNRRVVCRDIIADNNLQVPIKTEIFNDSGGTHPAPLNKYTTTVHVCARIKYNMCVRAPHRARSRVGIFYSHFFYD